MRCIVFALALSGLAATTGCYKLDIRQGNIIDQAAVERLQPGMSKREVQTLLGTPLLVDPFHPQRWDYIYYFFPRSNETDGERRRLSLFFAGDTLDRIEGDTQAPVVAAP